MCPLVTVLGEVKVSKLASLALYTFQKTLNQAGNFERERLTKRTKRDCN